MASGHLVTHRYLALLRDIAAHKLIDARRQLILIFPRKTL